ncbi:MAG: phosphoribosyltransferase [Thermoplasmata archaeon]
MEGFRCMLVSWKHIESWVSQIMKKMEKKVYKPDVIIGLSRGGLVPARIISDYLQLKDLYAIKTEHWGITATPDGQARITQGLPINIEGKKVLLVDDITDTGQSLSVAFEYVKNFNPDELKTATLLHITRSKFIPDFYAEEVPEEKWTWFIFPWNVYEDLTTIIVKMLSQESLDYNGILDAFKKYFYIKPKKYMLRNSLKMLENKKIVIRENGFYKKL